MQKRQGVGQNLQRNLEWGMRRSSGASTNAQTKNRKGADVRMRKISVAQTYPGRARFHRIG
jgi:hypothetical protein